MTTQVLARDQLAYDWAGRRPGLCLALRPVTDTDTQLLDIWLHDQPAHTQRAYRHDARCFMATDGWLTLADAAAPLEISLDAMRRRMRRSDLPKRQIRARHGLTWQVRLDGPPADPGTTLAATVVPTVEVEPTVQALLAYLRERDQQRDSEVAELREDLARARADLGDHAGQLAEAREQLRALSAPAEVTSQERPFLANFEGVAVEPTQPSTEHRNGRPWWRVWG